MVTDPTLGLDAARIKLERAALVISASGATQSEWGQAAILTAAHCAAKSFRGGVFLRGEFEDPVRVGSWLPIPLREMLLQAGCRGEDPPEHALPLHIGDELEPDSAKLRCWTDGWLAIAGPSVPIIRCRPGNALSGALAGAMAVSEAIRMAILTDLLAGKRTQRLSPLAPAQSAADGLTLDLLPSSLWLLGLGNLGQAVLWVLGLLPYRNPCAVDLVLQDMDTSEPENQDVQILTTPHWYKNKKARGAAAWAEARGFKTAINELPFGPKSVRDRDRGAPGLALVGVDNLNARRFAAREDSGFDLVIDAGLGGSISELFDIRIHGFPGARTAAQAWPAIDDRHNTDTELTDRPDLAKLVAQGRLDRCGALTISGQHVGIPSVAVAAATIQIAQAFRAIKERKFCDLVDLSLRNVSRATTHEKDFAQARLLLFEEVRKWPEGDWGA